MEAKMKTVWLQVRGLGQRRVLRVAGIILVILLGFLTALPWLFSTPLRQALSTAIDAPLTIEKISLNPLTQTINIDKLIIYDDKHQPLLHVPHGEISISWTSLWERALVISALQLQHPQLFIHRLSPQQYNFSTWLNTWLARPASPTPPRFAIHNIQLGDGEIHFNDHVLKQTHQLHALEFNLPFISTLATNIDTWVQPRLRAKLDGKPLTVAIAAQPFNPQQNARLRLTWNKLNLETYQNYLPTPLGIRHLAGEWQGDLQLHFVRANDGKQQLRLAFHSRWDNAAIEHNQALATWKSLTIDVPEINLTQHRLHLHDIVWQHPNLTLRPFPTSQTAASTPTTAPAWQWQVDQFNVTEGAFTWYADAHRKTAWQQITLHGQHWQNQRAQTGTFSSHAVTEEGGGELHQQGKIQFFPHLQAQGEIHTHALPLAPYAAWLTQTPAQPHQGTLDFDAHYQFERPPNQPFAWQLNDSKLKLQNLVLRTASLPRWTLGNWEADIATINSQHHTIDIQAIRGDGASWPLQRTAQGAVQLQALISNNNKTTAARQTPSPENNTASAWQWVIGKISLQQQVNIEDIGKKLKFALTPLSLEVGKLTSALQHPITLAMHNGFGKHSGQLQLNGTLIPKSWQWHGQINLQGLDLVPLQVYLAEQLRFSLSRGLLDVQGQLHLNSPNNNTQPTFKGRIGLRKVNAVEQSNRDPLFSWSQLQLQALQLHLQPSLSLDIGRINLDDFYSRLILRPEGRLNVQELWVPPSNNSTTQPPTATPVPRIRIGEISLQRGQVNFSDYFIKPNYNANLSAMSGVIHGLSSTDNHLAEITLTALQDRHAPVGILGTINPFGSSLSLDIEAKVRGIEMTPLSPYAVKYAGYGIEKGKMSFDVHYQVANRKLSAENRLMLDQLTFGEHVNRADAPNLPVKLAVALLKDRHGVIDINLPIGGSLDDPQFSLGGLVGKMFWNLLVKVATAPFSLLGALFEGVAEEPSQLRFEPGHAQLSVANESQLNKLAEMLRDKPTLHLEISGHINPTEDAAGLKQARLQQQLLALKRITHPDEDQVHHDEYPSLLSRLYRQTHLPDKPRNFIGLAKEIPVNEMESRLLAHQTVTTQHLRELAQQRADVIRDYLISKGQLTPERIFILAEQLEGGHHAAFNLHE